MSREGFTEEVSLELDLEGGRAVHYSENKRPFQRFSKTSLGKPRSTILNHLRDNEKNHSDKKWKTF